MNIIMAFPAKGMSELDRKTAAPDHYASVERGGLDCASVIITLLRRKLLI